MYYIFANIFTDLIVKLYKIALIIRGGFHIVIKHCTNGLHFPVCFYNTFAAALEEESALDGRDCTPPVLQPTDQATSANGEASRETNNAGGKYTCLPY